MILVLLSAITCYTASDSLAQNIQLTLNELKSAKGQIVLKVYKNQNEFEKESAIKTLKFEKKGVKAGSMIINFDVPPGIYGFSLIDDK